ncbi:hypothetical protein NCS57_00651300 [Fusarium keratoplasticum]|uniref:Uncharacterized protein n=1 Tax=Fusarium keratoplasticum TaxID=1328300 RepID=A0ACC0R3T2_9HYPO|nr:hypothetical protein NCS57_00651300 [Fusarium keratoplasticum]KAI8671752.1 hypothetical protein NCS57_00651300 [Fusarium keratoplasticum]
MAQNDKSLDTVPKSDTGQSTEAKNDTEATVNKALFNLFQELMTKGSNGPSFAIPLHPLPAFKGKDVTEQKKPGLFESYTDPEMKREVRQAMEGFDWKEAQEKLKESFANDDSDQTETVEEKLEILNEVRLKVDFHAIIKWLNEHQYLFKQTDKNWMDSRTQSRAIYKALPEEVIDGICERHNKGVRELTIMNYHDLTDMIKRYCENKIEIRKTHRSRNEDDTRKVTWAPTPPRNSSPSTKSTKTPRILRKEPDEVTNSKIDDLTAQLTQLSINLAKGQETQLQLAQIIQRENDRQAATGTSQPFRTNAVSIDQPQNHENLYTYAAYGSGRGGYQNNMACWYCAGRNHFPDTCADLAYDKSAGIASYDPQGGAALLGRGDAMLPPNLVYQFKKFGVRKLVHNWLMRFPESDLHPLVRRLEQHNKAGLRFTPTQPENNIIDDFIRKNPEALDLYRPKYKSPEGFDRLPKEITRGDRDILDSQNPPPGTSTNVILVNEDPTPFDQAGAPQTLTTTTVAVNANARKRVHVEDITEVQEAAQPIRKSTPIEKPAATGKEKSQRSPTSNPRRIPPEKGGDHLIKKANGANAVQVGEQDWGEAYWTAISERAGVNVILIDEVSQTDRTDDNTKDLQPGDYIVTTDAGTTDEETKTVEVRQNKTETSGKTTPTAKEREPTDQMVNNIELMDEGQSKRVAQSQELPRILVRLDNPEGKVIEAMVDTGSEGNIISQELAKACGLKVAPARASTTSFSQDQITMLGQTTVRLYLGNRAAKINVNLLSKPEVDWESGLEPDDVPTSLRWLSRESGEEVIGIVKAETIRQYHVALEDANHLIRKWARKKYEIRKGKDPPDRSKLEEILVNTLYKKKGVKIHPRDDVPSDGSTPEGDPEWKAKKWEKAKEKLQEDSKYRDWITPKFSDIKRGTRIYKERLQGLIDQVDGTLTREELDVFLEIMYNREAALAWEFSECGKLDPLVAPPQVIRVVEHKAWQAKGIPIPKGCEKEVIKLLRTRMERGILEEGHGPYRNPFFLVQKKDGQFRLINSATLMNKHTIRDSLIPPGCDEFSADFAMCRMLSLLDFFSGYDQMELAEVSRDLTSFMTPIGLLRMCTLPQGATNSVAQFTRNILRILRDLIPDVCRSFLDDICVRGPTTDYGGEEAAPGIRRFVLEHLINLDKVLVNIELSGCTVAGQKSQFCRKTAVVTGYLCGTYGRKPEERKVVKILEWEDCFDVGEVRSFLGIVGYYRQWIKWFAWIAKALTDLLKKDAEFVWGADQKEAMETLKKRITAPPILITLNYSEEAGGGDPHGRRKPF